MKRKYFYLDNAATTPLSPHVVTAMLPYMTTEFGNASTTYRIGLEAREAVEDARRKVADLIGATRKDDIIFTSGGTEADNMALMYAMYAKETPGHIITSSIEHPAIINTCRRLEKLGAKVTYIKPDYRGIIDPAEVEAAIKENTVLISVMAVNNETGMIQPIRKIAEIADRHSIPFHTDAVQAVGHVDIDVSRIKGLSMLSASAHKFNGPKGMGFLYIDKGDLNLEKVLPLITGGHQENGLRAGTENVAGIVGLGTAAAVALDNIRGWRNFSIKAMKLIFIKRLLEAIPESKINGDMAHLVGGIVNVCMPYGHSSHWQEMLNERDIYVGTGSACSSYSDVPSYVLTSMGLSDDEARRSLRFSFGEYYKDDEINYLVEQIKEVGDAIKEFAASR